MFREFVDRLEYKLDPFQIKACESLESGKSVLVAAPTGSGKTTVAEFGIWLSRSKQQRVIYTAPIKALSNQKFAELQSVYGKQEVGLLTGDININGDASILVMTTEVLRNMIYEDSARLKELSHVILDEVHYLADRARGAVWEEIILHLPKNIKLICLSATVSNAEEFGDWLNAVRGETAVIVSENRPVPLYQHLLVRNRLFPLFVDKHGELQERGRLNRELIRMERPGEHHRQRKRNRVDYRALVTELELNALLPGIVFIFSRNGCDQAVNNCISNGVRLTTRPEREEIRRTVKTQLSNIPKEDLYALGYRQWLQALEHGVAAHHAGLIPPFKNIVEKLFVRKLIKLVFATETLALGINMPAKSVVIEQLDKFNGQERVPLQPGEFTQLTGRAGRRGIDTEGHAIIAWENRTDLDRVATLASKRVYPLKSSFRPTYNMCVNLLDRLDFQTARSTLERSFAQFQADREMVSVAEEVRSEQNSLQGYRRAIERTEGAERKKWKDRARKLERNMQRRVRVLERRTGTIARVFDRLVTVLQNLGYLTTESNDPVPTASGELLRSIYGERDLLVAESLRAGIWDELNAVELAALCTALVYEPRRDEQFYTHHLPGGAFKIAFSKTLVLWDELDRIEEEANLARKEPPNPAMSGGMINWARGANLEKVLEMTDLGAGDFIRLSKQTIDLLDQIGRHLPTADESKKLISRGIIELSSRV